MSVALLNAYVDDVLAGRIVTGKPVRWACERHVRDLKRQGTEGFPYYFDEAKAEHHFEFLAHLKHYKGKFAGKRFEPSPWQAFIHGSIFGWLREADGVRRFNRAWIEVARKQGKTFQASAIGHYLLDYDKEPGAEIYTAATKRAQAGIMFRDAVKMRDKNASIGQRVKKYGVGKSDEMDARARLFVEETDSFWKALGADSETEDGLNPHGILIDEVHAHKDGGLINVLESGTGARDNRLSLYITTAGTEVNGYGHQLHEAYRRIVDPDSGIDDERAFVYIAELDEGDDWRDPEVWIKANPNLGVSIYPGWLADRVTEAQANPIVEIDVRTKNLNQWVQSAERWLPSGAWDACAGELSPLELEAELAGRRCYGGLDLSQRHDLAAFVLAFPWLEGEGYDLLPWLWMPEGSVDRLEKKDRVPYREWIRAGLIAATPGDVIDYEWIRADIADAAVDYDIAELAYDPWDSTETAIKLQEQGLRVVQCRQGYATISEPTKRLEVLVLSQKIRHGGHPVLRWMSENMQLVHDPAGNVKPSKADGKARRKIDGIVASIMALFSAGRAVEEQTESGYNARAAGTEAAAVRRGGSGYNARGEATT